MRSKDSVEFSEGYDAYATERDSNPYPENSNEYENWDYGRSEAQEDECILCDVGD